MEPVDLMRKICNDEGVRRPFVFSCGMLSLQYHLQDKRISHQQYLFQVKCIIRYLNRPDVVKQYILWNYNARGGIYPEKLEIVLNNLISSIKREKRRRFMSKLGKKLNIINIFENIVPVELSMLIAFY